MPVVPPTLQVHTLQALFTLSFFLLVPGYADETRDQKGNGAPAAKDAQPWAHG
jgi:hypothetical protein